MTVPATGAALEPGRRAENEAGVTTNDKRNTNGSCNRQKKVAEGVHACLSADSGCPYRIVAGEYVYCTGMLQQRPHDPAGA